MDMQLTSHDWPGAAGTSSLRHGGARPLDWQGLAARLAAAAACRDLLAAQGPVDAESASFDPAAARRLAQFESAQSGTESGEPVRGFDEAQTLRAINRIDSVEVKPGAPIPMGTAGTGKTGDRGLQ